jgi:hypothetical protein
MQKLVLRISADTVNIGIIFLTMNMIWSFDPFYCLCFLLIKRIQECFVTVLFI